MPIISVFYGLIIRIYYSDHNPPHFHAQYGVDEVIIEIKSGRILTGSIPPRLTQLLELWRRENLDDILKAWESAQSHEVPKKVKPLD